MPSRSLTIPGTRALSFADAVLAGACVVFVPTAGAQAVSPCRPSDEGALVLRSYLRELVTTTDPERVALRDDLRLAAMDSTKVVLVTDHEVCRKVAAGINTAFRTPSLVRQLRVFSVGKRLAAQDPGHPSGEYHPTMVVSARYEFIGSVLAP
jgi:hypothetical protein